MIDKKFMDYTSANSLYVLASKTICRRAAKVAITHSMAKTTAMVAFTQKVRLRLEGLKVRLKNTTGKTKSKGKKPKAPMNAFMSPKNGSTAAIVVDTTIERDLEITLGITFRRENRLLLGSASIPSSTSFAGCKYTYQVAKQRRL